MTYAWLQHLNGTATSEWHRGICICGVHCHSRVLRHASVSTDERHFWVMQPDAVQRAALQRRHARVLAGSLSLWEGVSWGFWHSSALEVFVWAAGTCHCGAVQRSLSRCLVGQGCLTTSNCSIGSAKCPTDFSHGVQVDLLEPEDEDAPKRRGAGKGGSVLQQREQDKQLMELAGRRMQHAEH